MTPLSKDAFAVMAVCPEAKKTFGITVDKIQSRQYKFVWTFKIDKKRRIAKGMIQLMSRVR